MNTKLLVNKKTHLLIILLLCIAPIKSSASTDHINSNTLISSPFYINTETNAVLDQDGLPLNFEHIIAPTINTNLKNESFLDTLSNNLRLIRGITVGNPLTPGETLLLTGTFIGIDIIDASHTLLSAHRYADNGTNVSYVDVLNFIARVTLDNYSALYSKPILSSIKDELVNANNLALTKGVVQFLVNQSKQVILNRIDAMNADSLASGASASDIENFTATANKGLGIVNRLITGESTFIDRCYFKIIKATANAADWIRTKIFRKPSMRDNLGDKIIDVVFANDTVQSLYNSAKNSINNATNYAAATGETIFNGIKWIVNTTKDANAAFTKTIETINGISSEIITDISQKSGELYATVTQTITSGTETVQHIFTVSANNAADAFSLAKSTVESALEILKNNPKSSLQALSFLQDAFIATKNVSLKDFIKSSVQTIEKGCETIVAAAVMNVITNSNDINTNLLVITALMVNNPDLFNLIFPDEETPNSSNPSADIIDMHDEMQNLFDTEINDLLAKLEKLPGNESDKINSAIQVNKEEVANSTFNKLTLLNFVDAKGDYKFDINELAKDNITVNTAKKRLTDLLSQSTSRTDKTTINKLISDIDTAVANRPVERSPEEQATYERLIIELNALIGTPNEQKLIDWVNELSDSDYNLVRDEIDVEIFKDTITQNTAALDKELSIKELIELKKIFNDFILKAEDFGYGTMLGEKGIFTKSFQDILTKAGINSPEKQQLLLNNITIIDEKLIETLKNNYSIAGNKQNLLNKITKNNGSIAFDALSNEGKIEFLNGLSDLTQEQRDSFIAAALQHTIDQANTAAELLALQKETFAQDDILLQALQDKIKIALTNEYKYLPPLDQYNFKRSLLDQTDFTDYSRAFKMLSLADQQAVASLVGISDIELKTFQKGFLADKIFFSKTFDEINTLIRDIKTINDKTPNYFSNTDIAGKHGYLYIADAIMSKTQDIIEQKIKSSGVASNSIFKNSADYFKIVLLDISSGDAYATAFRELPLTAQHELAQQFALEQDNSFKEFQNSLFDDEVGVATTPAELSALQDIATNLGIDTAEVTARLNKAIASGVSIEKPKARNIELNPDDLVKQQENSGGGTENISEPTQNEIGQEFDSESLSEDTFYDSYESEEERKRAEEKYQEENIAKKTEELAEKRTAEEHSEPKEMI